MLNDSSNKKSDNLKSNQAKNKKIEATYYQRVILGKGTVAEDWPSAKELWDNVKDEAQEVQKLLKSINDEANK